MQKDLPPSENLEKEFFEPKQEVPKQEVPKQDVAKNEDHEKKEIDPPHHNDWQQPTNPFQLLQKELESIQDPEHRLEKTIRFMEESLAQTGSPHFRDFWETRKACLELFKQPINPSHRVTLWAKYTELCQEARKLKEIFDEQSAFASEQIEMALKAIEHELETFQQQLEKISLRDFEIACPLLSENAEKYTTAERELSLLNVYASKTNALRKELIKTEMRVRQKNKFFARLSKLGDTIFPRRKELISEISQLFMDDVEQFIKSTFSTELKTPHLFDIREEIKALQNIAKVLTLNTETFSKTRMRLSECWDSIKNLISERKKVVNEQRAIFKATRDLFLKELEDIRKSLQDKQETPQVLDKKLDDLIFRMRKATLGKEEIRTLRDHVRQLRTELGQELDQESFSRKAAQDKKESAMKEQIDGMNTRLQQILVQKENMALEEVEAHFLTLTKDISTLQGSKSAKLELEKKLRQVKDTIEDRKEQQFLLLSDDTRSALDQLREILRDRKSRRSEVKAGLDKLKKSSGMSGFDISQAMEITDRIEQEKDRLEKADQAISEIEGKIRTITQKKK